MKFNMASKSILAITLVASLGACQATYSNDPYAAGPKEQVGALTGAVVGGVVGKELGKGSKNEGLATVLGVFAGTLIGASTGETLDRMDRMYMQQANQQALETARTNQTVEWTNPDSGNYGTVTPIKTYTGGSTVCREYTETVYVGGQPQQAYGTACRQADGSWKIVQ